MKRILFLLLLTVSVYGQNPSRFAKIQITGNTTSGTATKVNVQEANGEVNTQAINSGFNKNIGLGSTDVVGATTLLNQYSATPSDWTAQTYTLGSVVFYGGKQWIAKMATVAGDVPSVSPKWEEMTFESLANKTVTVDQTIIDGSTNAVSGNAVFDGLALKLNSTNPTTSGVVTLGSDPLAPVSGYSVLTRNTATGIVSMLPSNTYRFLSDDVDWTEISNKPSTFAPSPHTHVISDVTGLQGALNNKLDKNNPSATGTLTLQTDPSILVGTFDILVRNPSSGAVSKIPETTYRKSSVDVPWTEISGKPSTFFPSAHTHVISDVTGLQSALNNKADISQLHNPVTIGTANGLSLSTQQLSLGLASSGVTGALSGTDWNTFNNKQNALTNPVTGTGASGQISFWNGTGTQTGDNGLFWDNTSKRLGIGANATTISDAKISAVVSGGARVIEIARTDAQVTAGITGGGAGMCLSTVPFQNGLNSIFGNNLLGYMKNPLESIGIRASTVPLSDTGTEPIIKLEANGSGTNGFSAITTVANRPIFGIYNYSTRLLSVQANGNTLFGTTTDNGVDKLQVNGTISASPATTANQVVVKSQLDAFVPSFGSLEFNATDKTVWNNGKGDLVNNTSFGEGALKVTVASNNTAIGKDALTKNSTGASNTSVGFNSLSENTTGQGNIGIGGSALLWNSTGFYNIAIGLNSGKGINNNINNSIFIGGETQPQANNQTNQIVIGHDTIGAGSNTATLGNASITKTVLSGVIQKRALDTAPASATAVGTTGEIRVTDTHIYVCIATNTWVRSALTTW